MSIKGLLCAVGFVLLVGTFAFSLWAEWGPYSWLAAAQVALMDSYSEKLTFVLSFVFFLIPAMLLLFLFISGGRAAKLVGLGVPVLLVLIHLVATIYFVGTGGTQADASSFESAVHSASFVPQNITLEKSKLPALDLEKASGIKAAHSSDDGADLYIPFTSPSSGARVILRSKPENLKKLAAGASLTGLIHKAPLPYLVRHSWPQTASVFAVIIEEGANVRGSWMAAAAVYIVLIIWGAVTLFKSRRAKAAQQPAQI
ncbi:MAG: hypothetical protein NTY98_28760 [Verrucomicrobia bacterium]|nr:hypothetical protein [Verrucomicrobiota bacterium]